MIHVGAVRAGELDELAVDLLREAAPDRIDLYLDNVGDPTRLAASTYACGMPVNDSCHAARPATAEATTGATTVREER